MLIPAPARHRETAAPPLILADAVDVACAPGVAQASGVAPDSGHAGDLRYLVVVDDSGVTIRAAGLAGLVHASSTLLQLIDDAPADESGGRSLAAVTVADGPTYRWRGLSLDVSRTFFSVGEVMSVIDMLAYYKMNVLHLHLTDDEGWPFPVAGWPRLTAIGGAGARGDRKGGHYSVDDFARIVAYAAERAIVVVPEVDLPGHVEAACAAYPELAGAGGVPGRYWLDPREEHTRRFVADVLAAVAASTAGDLLHIGGDEPFGMPGELYAQFVDFARVVVRDLGKRLVGWQEIARTELGRGDVIQHWLDNDATDLVAEGSPLASELDDESRDVFLAESSGRHPAPRTDDHP